MENLNDLELTILNKLSIQYPELREHLFYTRVKKRKNTGIGMFVELCYIPNLFIEKLKIPDSSISTNETIVLKNLKYGLGYELDITDGKLNFIELITYGEEWDGRIDDFTLVT